MSRERPTRILMAKPGLDGHDRGVHALTLGLRDEGMEVVYTGLRQTPEMIAETALQESVDVVGLSCLSGGHGYLFPEVVKQLRNRGLNDVLVIGGGIIPEEDIPFLLESGINAIFLPGTFIRDIAEYMRNKVRGK